MGEEERVGGRIEKPAQRVIRREKILLALNKASARMQQARTSREIFEVVGEELRKFKFITTVHILLKGGTQAKLGYISLPQKMISLAEKLTGATKEGYKFNINQVDVYRKILNDKGTYLHTDFEQSMKEFIGSEGTTKNISRMIKAIGFGTSITAPLFIKETIVGLLDINSKDLTADEIPVITAFANQVSAALENIQLYRRLAKFNTFLKNVLQQSPLPTFVTDAKGICVMVNRAFIDFYHIPEGFPIRGVDTVSFPPNVKQGVSGYIKRALSGEIVKTDPIEFYSPTDGSKTVTICTLFPVHDQAGRITNVVAMHEDVTELKKVEERIKRKSQQLKALYEISFASVSLSNQDELLQFIVDKGREISGSVAVSISFYDKATKTMTPKSVSGFENSLIKKALDIVKIDYKKPISADTKEFNKFLAAKKPIFTDNFYMVLFGSINKKICDLAQKASGIKSILAVPLLIDDEVIGAFAYFFKEEKDEVSDIPFYKVFANQSSQVIKKAEISNRIKESEQKYHSLVECMQEGLGAVDSQENLIFINLAFAKMLGYGTRELLGMNLKELTTKQEFAKYRRETEKKKQGGASRYETKLYHKSGKFVYLSVSSTPLRDSGGAFQGTLGLVTDTTEQKKAEEQLRKRNEELERFNKVSVDRELQMIKLKKEINALCEKVGEEAKYKIIEEETAEEERVE